MTCSSWPTACSSAPDRAAPLVCSQRAWCPAAAIGCGGGLEPARLRTRRPCDLRARRAGAAAQLGARLRRQAWQCLRCGAYVPGEPQASGPGRAGAGGAARQGDQEQAHPARLRDRALPARPSSSAPLAFLVWRFAVLPGSLEQAFDRELPVVRKLFRQLGYNIDNSKLVGLLHHALTLSTGPVRLLAIGLAAYAVIELVEGIGLWLARRWGEYFAMVATSLGLPWRSTTSPRRSP